jgi:hypothetical protein
MNYYSPFFVGGVFSIPINPSIMRMWNAGGLTLKLGLFFFNPLDWTRQLDPFGRDLNLEYKEVVAA